MIKQLIALVVLSIIIVFSMSYVHQALQYLLQVHEWVSALLSDIFSPGQSGMLARSLIALLSVPFLVGIIPAVGYWIIKRHWLPYFMEIVWITWLIQAGALVMLYQAA